MTLLFLFLIMGVCVLLIGRFATSSQRTNWNRRRKGWQDQSSPGFMETSNWGLNDTPTQRNDADTSPGNYPNDLTVGGLNNHVNTCGDDYKSWGSDGGVDAGGTADLSGGGGGDFAGGGSGGDWGGNSNSE